MSLKPFEIELIIDHYANEMRCLMTRLDRIESMRDTDPYDDDLRDIQIRRIRTQTDELGERIEQLEELKKEL